MKTLPSGTTGFYNDQNQWVCTGSTMGRQSMPGRVGEPVKVYLRKLKWVDGDYDEQGAYWGFVSGTNIYWANFDTAETNEDIFVRAGSRQDAKEQVLAQLPNARFSTRR
jgi:hypothetical protein